MSDRCERCKRGYTAAVPREDVEWLIESPPLRAPGARQIRVARCTRCGSLLLDLFAADAEKPGVESHDVCVVFHDASRAAVLDRNPTALAAISPQLRRRHLEELVAQMGTNDRVALDKIEHGLVESTELFRALVTRALAHASELPPINDVRPRTSIVTPKGGAGAVGLRAPLDLGDGSRVILEPTRERLLVTRMRGDAVLWRSDIPVGGREVFMARVTGRAALELVVLVGAASGEHAGALFLVRGSDGAIRGPGIYEMRAAAFEAQALPGGCTFVSSYQSFAVLRDDASIAWKGSAAQVPVAIPIADGVVVIDAPWRLVAITLPSGTERWSMPVDRGAAVVASGDDHLLLTTSDVVARLEVAGSGPRMIWMASGASALPLAGGGAAVVRDRWEKSGRTLECVVFGADGKRRFIVPRPETTKVPVAELAPGVLLYHSGSDAAVSVDDKVTYALALPDRHPLYVTVEESGVWVEYEGIVDRIDATGKRSGRWRVGS